MNQLLVNMVRDREMEDNEKTSRHEASDAAALVLAAGKGTRMHSPLPKVLHQLLDKPMLWYILETLDRIFASRQILVAGHGYEQVKQSMVSRKLELVYQSQQLGTGHALQEAWPAVKESGLEWLLVINGDTPLVSAEHLCTLLEHLKNQDADMGFITLSMPDPGSYGRVLRQAGGEPLAIIEAKDFDPATHGHDVYEVNSGIYAFKTLSLQRILFQLDADNAQKEFYITQLVSLAAREGMRVTAVNAGDCPELLGINTPGELLRQEERIRAAIVDKHIEKGVYIRTKDSVRIGAGVQIGPGAEVTGPAEIYGRTRLASGCRIASNCYIQDSFIGEAHVFSFSHIEKSVIGDKTKIGPFARLRPGAEVHEKAAVGNFVEIKNSSVGSGSKINHLSYIGDTWIGRSANVGAGTITCNYDGREKHRTTIGDGVFVGSNTALVAPVCLHKNSMVGAGSTITRDVSEGSLSIARARQKNLEGKNPLKNLKDSNKA